MIKKKEISCSEVMKSTLDRIEEYDGELGSYISVFDRDNLMKKADESDKRYKSGVILSEIDGIPISVKDNMHVVGLNTTCGSNMLKNYSPCFNATVIDRIIKNGGIIVGKTNCDEFAMGSTTETSAFKNAKNPWNFDKIPGGSSGGSAASVAAGMCQLSLGSDTGGSIRQPSAFCGIAGLKPTYGLTSRFGLVAYASSLDQIGPMSRDVYGLGAMLNIISGHDSKDSTSINSPAKNYLEHIDKDIKGLKIAVFTELYSEGVADNIRKKFDESVRILKEMGAIVEEISFPAIKYIIPAYYFIATAEASSNLARYDGVKYGYRSSKQASYEEALFSTRSKGFGKEVKKRILLGNFVLSSGYYDQYYNKAVKLRKYIQSEMNKIFTKYDAVITPTTPELPFNFNEGTTDPLKLYLWDVTTVIANLAGIPALSVPCGLADGMPVGLQIMGKAMSEDLILRIGSNFEKSAGLELIPVLNKTSNYTPSVKNEFTDEVITSYSNEKIAEISSTYMNREKNISNRVLCGELKNYIGKKVTVSGWIHKIISLGGLEFFILRDRTGFTQLVIEQTEKRKIHLETVVEINGTVTEEKRSVYNNIEIQVEDFKIIGHSHGKTPLNIYDDYENISLPVILDNRTISIRNTKIQGIFTIQSEMIRLFGDFLRKRNFTEIKTPKLISSGTEGGSNIFEVKYFEKQAFLAQSPQFYKQIMVGSGYERVFEVGPVFRAELHNTVRHLNEYTSMDFEIGFIKDEQDIIDVQEALLQNMMDELMTKYDRIVKDFKVNVKTPDSFPRIHFLEALEISARYGVKDTDGDISPEAERVICDYFEKEKGSSFVYILGYPVKKRPMYAMPDERLPGYTRSFDLLFKGLEITTGGQRINEYEALKKNIINFGSNPNDFSDYLETFKHGMPPHGGLGMGLERLTMKFLGLDNVREASLFPRDRNRLTP